MSAQQTDSYVSATAVFRAPTPEPEDRPQNDHGHTQPLPHAHAQAEQAQVGIGFAEILGHEAEHALSLIHI
jgi:hypothetical protein